MTELPAPDPEPAPDPAAEDAAVPASERPLSLREERVFELIATVILAAATLASAWSGYQATRWNGVQAQDYLRASSARVESTKASTKAGQFQLYDSQNFTQWLNAYYAGNTGLAALFEKRFRAEFQPAFNAWMATDPLHNASAPAGPMTMPEYKVAEFDRATELEAQATALFDAGNDANEIGDQYVLNTVFLASALFIAGIAGRFKWRPLRASVLVLAGIALGTGLALILRLPIQ